MGRAAVALGGPSSGVTFLCAICIASGCHGAVTPTDDNTLLRRFALEGDDAAFTEIVRRRIDFVHNVALRRMGGDTHLAYDVAQLVFQDLARKAGRLSRHPFLTSWLYTSTRYAAAQTVRTQARWKENQNKAQAMENLLSPSHASEPDWDQLRPVLDRTLDELPEKDRLAILLRYFEGRSLAEVGSRLGLAENAARMRVERALEKLRLRLARRGIVSTAAALGLTLAAQPVVRVPMEMATAVAGSSIAGVATGGPGAVLALLLMSMNKIFTGVAIGLVLGALYFHWENDRLNRQLAFARNEQADLTRAVFAVENRIRTLSVAESAAAAGAVRDGSDAGSVSDPVRIYARDLTHLDLSNLTPAKQASVAQIKVSYAVIFRQLGLDPEKEEQLAYHLSDFEPQNGTGTTNAIRDGLDLWTHPELVEPFKIAARSEPTAAIRELLGEDDTAALLRWRESTPDIVATNQTWALKRRLTTDGGPEMTESQAAQIFAILAAAVPVGVRPPGVAPDNESLPLTDALVTRMSGVLSPPQIESLQKLARTQATARAQQQTQLRSSRELLATTPQP